MATNLAEALPQEIKRVQEIRDVYLTIPAGVFAATMMQIDINYAVKTLAEGDVIGMLGAYQKLIEYDDL